MSDPTFDPITAVYTPPEVASYGLAAIEKAKTHTRRGLRFPLEGVDDYFAPMFAPQMCAVIAQTSNNKSGFLHFWEHQAAKQLQDEGRVDEAIVHISVEEDIEEQAFLEFARVSGESANRMARGDVQDWNLLTSAALKVGAIPIYRIGESLARADDMPNLYMSNMIRAIKALVSGEVTGQPIKPAALFFDYLQAFPIDPEVRQAGMEGQRRLQVRQDTYRLRQAAAYFQCPVVVAVQAKQELNNNKGPLFIPGVYDGEESSSIGQRADRIIQLWMPKMNHPVGKQLDLSGNAYYVADNGILVKVGKQRGGLPSGRMWPCLIDFDKNYFYRDPQFIRSGK